MKRFLVAMALTSVLAVSTFAGEISTSGVTAPPPDEPPAPTAPGEIPTSGHTQSNMALTIIQLILAGVV